MKLNGKSITVTIGLLVILITVVLVEISLFIAGPARKYEASVEKEEQAIQTKYKNMKDLDRHVFQYVVYIGQDKDNIVWFNVNAEAITSKERDTLKTQEAKAMAEKKYGMKDAEVTLGYGYDNPVYVIKGGQCELLLDYDTLKTVYYLDKEVK